MSQNEAKLASDHGMLPRRYIRPVIGTTGRRLSQLPEAVLPGSRGQDRDRTLGNLKS